MPKSVFVLILSACFTWPLIGFADPSKPIREAMNHPASAFDLYMHTLRLDFEKEFEREREQAQLGRFIASLIERGGLIDKNAKEGEEFSVEFVSRLKTRPNYSFDSFTYDFQTNRFTLNLNFHVPDEFPVLQTDLSFEGEKERKAFMEEVTKRAWETVSFKFPTHRIQNGYTTKGFDEDAFKQEVAENTVLVVEWPIFAKASKASKTATLLAEKGVSIRTYKGTRSQMGTVSVDYDDFIPKDKK